MKDPLKISARNAGQAALEKFCRRCCWWLTHVKPMPFLFGMPGLMFFAEAAEKAFLLAYLEHHGAMPKSLGPFVDCKEPVEFPYSMKTVHEKTGVILTAQPDMIFRNSSKKLSLIDLKTSKPEGGGKVFLPQYEIQCIGYSYVVEANDIGEVSKTGLVYGDVQIDEFKDNPLKFATKTGFQLPFNFHGHEVELDYTRLTKCLEEVKKIWNLDRPPKGRDGCRDCKLLARLINFDNELQSKDNWKRGLDLKSVYDQARYRQLVRSSDKEIAGFLSENIAEFDEGGMWANWDFCEIN
jgi:hypothetical protein